MKNSIFMKSIAYKNFLHKIVAFERVNFNNKIYSSELENTDIVKRWKIIESMFLWNNQTTKREKERENTKFRFWFKN